VLPNPLKRYLLNKETKPQYGQDGSLTLYFADAKPKEAPDGNWLPAPKGIVYSLTFRFYRPKGAVAHCLFPATSDERVMAHKLRGRCVRGSGVVRTSVCHQCTPKEPVSR
jgi:hypothetical protein